MGRLDGKAVLLTGGASGIGRAVARRFVAEGARVCVLDLFEQGLALLAQELGDRLVTVPGDVRRLADHERAVAACERAFGGIDVLIGNAGVFDGYVSLSELPRDAIDAAFDEIFHVNVKGYLLAARAALPALLRSSGNMVFTVSSAGFYTDGGGPLYTASKHAVVGLVRDLAYDLAPRIRVNGVAPGGTITGLGIAPSLRPLRPAPADVSPREQIRRREERARTRNPLGIAAHPEDHVGAYLLLASDEARAMTGVIINSDGGVGIRGITQMAGGVRGSQ